MLHKTDGSHTNRPFFCTIGSDVRETSFSPKENLPRSVFCFFSSRKENVPLLFFLEEKNGQLAREAQPLRRTDAGTSCVVVGRNTTAGMPPSSALSLPVSAAPARQLSRASRPRKRKSSAEQLFLCAPVAFANMQHKTDGSHTNRPFLCPKQDVRESFFSPQKPSPRSVFCFFSSRKENVPLSRKENVPPSFSIYANKQSKTHGHMQTVRFGRCCVLSEKTEKSECVPRAAGSPPPTVGGPRRMQRRVQRSSASCTGRSPYRACPV